MLRKLGTALGLVVVTASASAQVPLTASQEKASTGGVPTYWVMLLSGERDGSPYVKTITPETMGGTVKGTGPWSCAYPPTARGSDGATAYEAMEVACAVGDAEVFLNLRCDFLTKPRPGKSPGKGWKRNEMQTLNLRRKGDAKSTITVSLRCDVDSAFARD
ncbi:MAG TPA: hypothetical protein VIW29_14365 [Polyangiaceae bacterium]